MQGLIISSIHITTVAMYRPIDCFRVLGSICSTYRRYSVQ
jgi:hypothetical protein